MACSPPTSPVGSEPETKPETKPYSLEQVLSFLGPQRSKSITDAIAYNVRKSETKKEVEFFKRWLLDMRLYTLAPEPPYILPLDDLCADFYRNEGERKTECGTSPHHFSMTLGGTYYTRRFPRPTRLVITSFVISNVCIRGKWKWVFDRPPCCPGTHCPPSNYALDGKLYPTADDIPNPQQCTKHLAEPEDGGRWRYKAYNDLTAVPTFDNLFELWSSIDKLPPVSMAEALATKR
jgi:hypothetical protein